VVKYLITGRQGTGKTTVIRELQRRGYTAYNTDEMDGLTRLEETATGKPLALKHSEVNWDLTSWNWQKEPLEALLNSGEIIFIGAVTTNQATFYDRFDRIFALIVTPETLARNLASHEHGYDKSMIERVLAHQYRQQRFLDDGAIPINNDRPISDTVDEILSYVTDD
jgi:dephospho-CoA kinase